MPHQRYIYSNASMLWLLVCVSISKPVTSSPASNRGDTPRSAKLDRKRSIFFPLKPW